MYDLGVIGGMGSEATAEFFYRLVEYTDARNDQEHIKVCILNDSSIPDRSSFIVEEGESPVNYLNNCIADLARLNTNYFVMPCNTSHYFINKFVIPPRLNFINMVKETSIFIESTYPKKKVCILGTEGTIKGRVYEQYNIKDRVVYPNESEQQIIMEVIRRIKSNNAREEISTLINCTLKNISERIGEVVFVLACTELSLYTSNIVDKYTVVDAMEVLIVKAIENCGYKVRREKLKTYII